MARKPPARPSETPPGRPADGMPAPGAPAPPPRLALVVAPRGPRQHALGGLLVGEGWAVRRADGSVEALDRLGGQTPDLLVVSLEGWTVRDLDLLPRVRRRAPLCRILALAPDDRREVARQALAVGVDLLLPDPCMPEAFVAAVQALCPFRPTDVATLDGAARIALRELTDQVQHAVNNAVQRPFAELQLEAAREQGAWPMAAELLGDLKRVRAFNGILSDFLAIGTAKAANVAGRSLLGALAELARDPGRYRWEAPAASEDASLLLDGDLVVKAFAPILEVLAAEAASLPVVIRPWIRRFRLRPKSFPRAAGGASFGPQAEVLVQAVGVRLTTEQFELRRGQILWSHEETREPLPGLAGAALIARLHGGDLVRRDHADGTWVGLRLPQP